jgi:hypothetical protein
MRALTVLVALVLGSGAVSGRQSVTSNVTPPVPLSEHRDAQGRFRFAYPRSYGTASPGTNDGFNGRTSIRFSSPPAPLGGELVLTHGFPYVDIQAVGGLYDSIALEVFPDALRRRIVAQLPRLSARTFCTALGQTTHLDVESPALASLTPDQRAGIRRLDLVRSIDLKVARCEAVNGVIAFHRVVRFQEGAAHQHIFGAIRFLEGDVSSVQLVAGAGTPPLALVDEMAAVVRSVTLQQPKQ